MRHEAGEVTTDGTTPPPDGPSQHSQLPGFLSITGVLANSHEWTLLCLYENFKYAL